MTTKLSEATNIDSMQMQEQAAAPSTPAAGYGQQYISDAQRSRYVFDTAQNLILGGSIFAATADKVVASTGAETTIIGTGDGSATLAAVALVVGRTIRITVRGYLGTKAATAGTLNIKATVAGTEVCSTSAITVTDNVANVDFEAVILITCRTIGGSGTVVASGHLQYNDGTVHSMVKTTATTIDTTASAALDVTATWGTSDAANTITSQIALIEYLH